MIASDGANRNALADGLAVLEHVHSDGEARVQCGMSNPNARTPSTSWLSLFGLAMPCGFTGAEIEGLSFPSAR